MPSCRICAAALETFISFGRQPLSNAFLTPEQVKGEYFFELATAFCQNCYSVQIVDQPAPEQMFHDHYAFFSGTSKHMAKHFAALAESVSDKILTGKSDPFVVEMGSNDGILLKNFAAKSVRHLGIEPSANVAKAAEQAGVRSLVAFFGPDTARQVVRDYGQADVFLAANVTCHIPDQNAVWQAIGVLLKPDGVAVFEDPYLGDVVSFTSYDQIYDEHVFLFSLLAVQKMVARHGFVVVDVEPQTTHGGSMRYTVARKNTRPASANVTSLEAKERAQGLDKLSTYVRFRESCEASRAALVKTLKDLKAAGKSVGGYAATSKGATVLNYCGIGKDLVPSIADTTPIKIGKLSPGLHIPIISRDEFKNNPPDVALLFAYNHKREIFENESWFAQDGRRWLLFVPDVHFEP